MHHPDFTLAIFIENSIGLKRVNIVMVFIISYVLCIVYSFFCICLVIGLLNHTRVSIFIYMYMLYVLGTLSLCTVAIPIGKVGLSIHGCLLQLD